MTNFILNAKDVCKSFRQGAVEIPVLKGVNLKVQESERITIMGASGSGKSTLLNLLGTLAIADRGTILIQQQDIALLSARQREILRNQHIGFVYQFHHLLKEFSALENAAMPLFIRGDKKKAALSQAESILQEVGLSERIHHKPGELSGGERQRVAIARALATQPALVLMDEPTGNLDEENAQVVRELIDHLSQTLGLAFVVVTHDKKMAQCMDTHYELKGGLLEHKQLVF